MREKFRPGTIMTNEITLPALLLELGITVCVRVSDLQRTLYISH